MDVNSNKYTYTFAIIMVVIVAAMLSVAATSLKPFQDRNVELEKMQDILKSINVNVERDAAEGQYKEYIKEELVLKNGEVQTGAVKAFDIDMAAAVAKSTEEREVPLYIAEKDGEKFFIIPLRGKGLWGPIWGYISLKSDGSTIFGTTFGHKGETPGLGAEIVTDAFREQFLNKEIMENGEFVSIQVRKGDASGMHQVDGISGGTITSAGVGSMLQDCLKPYVNYFKNQSAVSAAQ